MIRSIHFATLTGVLLVSFTGQAQAQDLATQLRALDTRVIPADSEQSKELAGMLARDARARLQAGNQRDLKVWQGLTSRGDWERYRDRSLAALRASLGQFPEPPRDLRIQITRTLQGDGYRIQNLVFESRPGLLVTANLYRPAAESASQPGILICHSHHNPKTQSELQDMGILWARLGCLVLVMDQLGHGERRQHPFRSEKDYAGTFRPTRQDYYFRYNSALQLHLLGESLVGWMVWDMMRGIDLLLAQPGIDKHRLIVMGAVAGGGDPAAVTAALDPRIAAAVPFNFGGPQPETTYPLPEDAEARFNYAGSGSWESTRNLRLSVRDSFLPWTIVGSLAPRRLVYAHEFAWDRDRDPVWKRFEKIYAWYEAPGNLAAQHGRGSVRGQAPESTHCNNIGAEHRKGIYPPFERWFGIQPPLKENSRRHPTEELLCLTPALQPRPLHELAGEVGAARSTAARERLARFSPAEQRARLREDWTRLLGNVEAGQRPTLRQPSSAKLGNVSAQRFVLTHVDGVPVPLLLLLPTPQPGQRLPVVVAFAQEGKQVFVRQRAEPIAALLEHGIAVCLPDLRGTGETRPGDGRGRTSAATSISATELMLGQTLLGSRLLDLRSVLQFLRQHARLDSDRIALWGDSFAPVNPPERNLAVPLDAAKLPDQAEPLGGLLALLGGLFDERICAIHAQGGLVSYNSVLKSSFCYLPHDAVIPGALTVGDLPDLAAALAPRPLSLSGLVDGLNRRVPDEPLRQDYAISHKTYGETGRLVLSAELPEKQVVKWLQAQLSGPGR